MGVIKRQGLKQSLISFIGVGIAMLSYLFVYPLALEGHGLTQYLIGWALALSSFIGLGSSSIAIRYFPEFRDKDSHKGFLTFLLIFPLFGFLLFAIIIFYFQNPIFEFFVSKGEIYEEFVIYIIPLSFFASITNLLVAYVSNFHRIVVPSIFRDLLPKIVLPLSLLLLIYEFITLKELVVIVLILYMLITISIVLYLYSIGELNFRLKYSFYSKVLLNKILDYGAYSILGGVGFVLANQIDVIMVGTFLELESTSIFTIAYFMGNVIDIPRKAINSISSPIISDAWKRNDLAHIHDLYKKTSLNQLIFGLWVFLGVWGSIDLIYEIMPNTEIIKTGKYVVLLTGLTRIVDMATGINNLIIGHSKYFRFNFYAVLALAVLNIINNFMFIPVLYINGAALATFTSVFIYNVLKFSFVLYKFKMTPFSINVLYVILLGIFTYLLILFIPTSGNSIINLLLDISIRSLAITVIFIGGILYFRLSGDVTSTFQSVLMNIRKVIPRSQ